MNPQNPTPEVPQTPAPAPTPNAGGDMPPASPAPQQTSQPAQMPSQPQKSKKKLGLIIGIIVGVLVLVGGLGFAAYKILPSLFSSIPSYSNTEEFSNTKADEGSRYSFKHPKELEVVTDDKDTTELQDEISDAKDKLELKQDFYSKMQVQSIFVGETQMKAINSQKDDLYDGFRAGVQDGIDSDNFTVSNEQNTDIDGKTAYSFDISYTTKKDKTAIKGTVALVLGKETVYTITVSAPEQVWTKNTQAFSDMIASLQVDQ